MSEPRIIRKHSNRRLYDASRRGYLVLEDVRRWVVRGRDFKILDNKKADVTRDVLLQVVAVLERRPNPSLSLEFLLDAIRSHARLPGVVAPTFLEQSLRLFQSTQPAQTTPVSDAPANRARRAKKLAEKNYQRWRTARLKIYRIVSSPETSHGIPS